MRRTAVAVVVPVLGVAAHGAAAGTPPTPLAVALSVLVGVLMGFATPAPARLIGLFVTLAVGQVLTHFALSVGGGVTGGPGSLTPRGPAHAMPMHHMGGHAIQGRAPSGVDSFGMLHEHLLMITHPLSVDGSLMVLTHVVMIPVCAVLIALAGTVAAAATAVVAVLQWYRRQSPRVRGARVRTRVRARHDRLDRAAGAGVRGPPPVLV